MNLDRRFVDLPNSKLVLTRSSLDTLSVARKDDNYQTAFAHVTGRVQLHQGLINHLFWFFTLFDEAKFHIELVQIGEHVGKVLFKGTTIDIIGLEADQDRDCLLVNIGMWIESRLDSCLQILLHVIHGDFRGTIPRAFGSGTAL
jgi:hypothetical protein